MIWQCSHCWEPMLATGATPVCGRLCFLVLFLFCWVVLSLSRVCFSEHLPFLLAQSSLLVFSYFLVRFFLYVGSCDIAYSCLSLSLMHSAWFGGSCMVFISYPVRSHGSALPVSSPCALRFFAMYQYMSSRSLS